MEGSQKYIEKMKGAQKYIQEYEMRKFLVIGAHEEIYKPIPNYDNYEVSIFGNVRKKSTGLILKYSFDRDNIRHVTLNKDGIKKKLAVWYLELFAFE
jgi:hypothetical protein